MEYPILIKPAESSGSRGSMICEDRETARAALVQAKETSRNGKAVLEKYMQDAQEFQFTYFLVNGKAYLIRTADSYEGSKADRLERVVACGISPSRYTDEYVSTTHEKVVSMFRKLGLKNGPCFMQGFYDHGVFRFFDPGMRFPGVDYDRVYQREFGVDLAKLMVELALTGKIAEDILPDDMARLNGKTAAVLFPFMKAKFPKRRRTSSIPTSLPDGHLMWLRSQEMSLIPPHIRQRQTLMKSSGSIMTEEN